MILVQTSWWIQFKFDWFNYFFQINSYKQKVKRNVLWDHYLCLNRNIWNQFNMYPIGFKSIDQAINKHIWWIVFSIHWYMIDATIVIEIHFVGHCLQIEWIINNGRFVYITRGDDLIKWKDIKTQFKTHLGFSKASINKRKSHK